MGAISNLFATQTPANSAVPISSGSGAANESLNGWVTSGSSGVDIQTALDALSSTHGAVLFRGAGGWVALEPGVPGGYLLTNGSGADPTWSLGGAGPLSVWVAAVDAAGGTYEADSKTIAFDFLSALEAETYYPKIIWLAAMLGGNLAAARVPLIDVLGVGIMSNTSFVDGDFSQSTGLQGGSGKRLDSLVFPADLNASLVGGVGFWETNAAAATGGSDSAAFGCYGGGGTRWMLDLRAASTRTSWGSPPNSPSDGGAVADKHYYGQSFASNDRRHYIDAVEVATNTSADGSTPESGVPMTLLGTPGFWYGGRCGLAYLTDGTLTPTEITSFHALLDTYLMIPTGR